MKGIGDALTRKLGPFPAWVWAGVVFIGLWWYRSKVQGDSTVSGTGTGSVAPAAGTPQDVSTLDPGQSAYDPNTGLLSTAPGGAGDGGTTGTDLGTAFEDLAQALLDSQTSQTTAGSPIRKTRKPPKLKGRGAIRAPSSHKKPVSPKGYRTRGLGHGAWEFVPKPGGKRQPKDKAHHGKPTKGTRPDKPGNKTQPRSQAHVKHQNGGRTTARASVASVSKPSAGSRQVHPNATTERGTLNNRQSTPLVSTPVVRQRPVASNQPNRPVPKPAPVSKPATRSVRGPTKAMVKKR